MTNSPQGFKDDSNGTFAGDSINDYECDSNGNMIKDENKKITGITYNHLNLPSKITFGTTGTINYLYDAAGVKLQKKVTQGTTVTTTDYLGGYQYTNNVLDFFPTAEGYVKRTLVSGVSYFNYVFNHTDHLGNVRVSYTKDPTTGTLKIIEENHNYPFGLKHNYNTTDYQFTPSGSGLVLSQVGENGYNYQYNGKEWQDELGLNVYLYGFRDYDPAVGRWNVIDQLTEKYHTSSPYAFVQNNPIINREIDGRYFDEKNEKKAAKIEKQAEKKATKLENKANKIDKKGGDSSDLRQRVTELKKSSQDVKEMRNNETTEFRYAKLNGKEVKSLGLNGPSTINTGLNSNNDNVVTMFTEKNMGNQIHETRHGGDVARGNLCFDNNGGYGVSHEISAYRAQYSWDGKLQYRDVPSQDVMLQRMIDGQNPTTATITNINQINLNVVNSMVDPGFISIYPPISIPLNIWNNN